MAINFPSNPNVGDTFTAAGTTWMWNGQAWVAINVPGGGGGGANTEVGDTPPPDPAEGWLWWDSSIGQLFVAVGDPSVWVVANSGMTGPQGPAGDPALVPDQANNLVLENSAGNPLATFNVLDNLTTLYGDLALPNVRDSDPGGDVVWSNNGVLTIGAAGSGGGIDWSALPASVRQVPIAVWVGKPDSFPTMYISVAMALTIPAGLVGSTGYSHVATTNQTVTCNVSKIQNGTTIAGIGTIVFNTTNGRAGVPSGDGASLVPGDVIRFSFSGSNTAIDGVSVTLMAMRV